MTDAEAIHPGYGFLSENADFAERVEKCGFAFIGPTPETIRMMGDKVSAKQAMIKAGVPCVPAPKARCPTIRRRLLRIARDVGYPVIIKAAGGGGGRGMRVVHTEAALINAVQMTRPKRARRSAIRPSTWRSTSRSRVTSRSRSSPRAQERDLPGRARLLDAAAPPEDDRRSAGAGHPAPRDREDRQRCVEACKRIGYRGAGTFEFLYENGEFYFIEMNTRVQVEHR